MRTRAHRAGPGSIRRFGRAWAPGPPAGIRYALGLAALLALFLPVQAQGQDLTLAEARAFLQSGRYDEALDALRTLAGGQEAPSRSTRIYARALMEVGRYGDALDALGRYGRGADADLENVRGELLYRLGRIQEAEGAFRRAVESRAEDLHTARLNLGILLWDRGDRQEALALFDSFIDVYNRSTGGLTAEDLMAVGKAVRYLGVTNPVLFQDALLAFDGAAEVDPADPRPDLLVGELFLEKYKATDAREAFGAVLERNPRNPRALLGQAKILDFEGVGGATDLVRQALEVNPNHVDARVFLASLHLKTEDYARAESEAREAVEVNPNHLEALSVLATAHYFDEDMGAYEEVRGRIQALNPRYADLYTTLAEQAVNVRMYQEAVELAGRAVALDSTSWRSYGVMGMNQLRTRAFEEGRRSLETAFAGDPYNLWYMNTLDLLDTFAHYEVIPTDHFEILLHEREAALLGPYARVMAEAAYNALRARYGIDPPIPIRLEIFPSHADFSVRTLGHTGLGALGVSFGSTLVMDSPSALEPGDFNWASTMWHEVAHAFHLAMTNHRVPRWFTEGLAVHEQRKARTRWGHKPSPGWLQAYQAGRLHPVSRLNQGFIRPEYPEQVVFSYYQASLVFELIESRWGLETILAMLRGYRDGGDTPDLVRRVLGMGMEEFDQAFEDYVQTQWGDRIQAVAVHGEGEGVRILTSEGSDLEALRLQVMANPGSFPARLAFGRALYAEERFEEAERELRAALALFPEYGGRDSPYLYLASIHKERGELERAARALNRLGDLNETLFPVHAQEAELWLELGDSLAAARAMEKSVEITPFEVEPHLTLAELYAGLEEYEGAVLERRAILALDPVDRADAHYRLAVALAKAGDRAEARKEVLRALEIAPSYEDALELLLELRGGGQGDVGRMEGEDSPRGSNRMGGGIR